MGPLGPASRADLALVERWPAGDGACADTPLRLTFDQPPVRGGAGEIEVCRAADGQPVASVDLADAQPAARFGFSSEFLLRYEPAHISGKTASIRLPAGKLAYG